jgi:hypothetical protein
MKRIMPCQKQDILTLIGITAERLNDMDGADAMQVGKELNVFADECTGAEARFLKNVATAIVLHYGKV